MSLEITKKYFKYSFDKPSSYAFHALSQNYFVKNVLHKRKDKISSQIFFRLFRTGIIGDILYKAGEQEISNSEHDAIHEILASLFESYLTLARSIYDYLLIFLKDQYNVEQTSFNKFLKRVEKGGYPEIEEKFRIHLSNKIFSDLRNLRDSSVHKTANVFIYVKDKEYRVEANVYNDDGGLKERLDESLHTLIFGYTTGLLLLMAYIAEKETGKSFKEQIALDKVKLDE